MTDNYIDVHHEYFVGPDEDGIRTRTVDVWYATRPASPQFGVVDYDDRPVEGQQATVQTAWTLHKAAQNPFYIVDRDDIAGLRLLLDKIEQDFDRRDMEALMEHVENQGNEEEDVD